MIPWVSALRAGSVLNSVVRESSLNLKEHSAVKSGKEKVTPLYLTPDSNSRVGTVNNGVNRLILTS